MKSSGRFKSGASLEWISVQNFIKMRKTVHELTWQVRGLLRVGSSLSFQPSHAFCLNKIEEIDSNSPPLALYEKNNIRSDPSAGCNFVKNTETEVTKVPRVSYDLIAPPTLAPPLSHLTSGPQGCSMPEALIVPLSFRAPTPSRS